MSQHSQQQNFPGYEISNNSTPNSQQSRIYDKMDSTSSCGFDDEFDYNIDDE